ncbi:hypothetical protein EDD16DRAFT_1579433 [Pisolithus croceorrhizus]|nr:hypothetical protein EDD16DRAFT_1579433 [Pisolithus croceorrhizus]
MAPCRFFSSPGGCRRGDECHFSHNIPRNGGSPVPGSAPSTPRFSAVTLRSPPTTPRSTTPSSPENIPRSSETTPRSPVTSPPPPRGFCRFYWESGRCRREFECRYKHMQAPQARTPPAHSSGTVNSSPLRDRLAPFLTEQGLARMSAGHAEGFLPQDASNSLSPVEAHNLLQRFLLDNYKFQTTFQVYAFLTPLKSANPSNSKWTPEDGQLLLNSISSQNGLLRIVDILCWPQVSSRAGSGRDVLSFQRGIVPLFEYLSSDFVVRSTMVSKANALFTVVLQNLPKLADAIEDSLSGIMTSRSFMEFPASGTISKDIGSRAFQSLAGVLYECLVRFKNAALTYPRLASLVTNLHAWFKQWSEGVRASPPAFDDPFQGVESRVVDLLINLLREKVDTLKAIVDRELDKQTNSCKAKATVRPTVHADEGLVAALRGSYDPPGELRQEGPRHDNDHVEIYDIRIAPTHQELMCPIEPFLPATLYDAPHPASAESMERLLDIQFRLLREELTAPLRRAVQLVCADLKLPNRSKTQLHAVLQKSGGKYVGHIDSHNSIMFNIYAGANFLSVVPDHRGLSVSLTVHTPPGRASSRQQHVRVTFWQGMSGKRLPQGGLITLVWEDAPTKTVSVHLGVVASSSKELTDYVRTDQDHVKLRIVFFDSSVELKILQSLENRRTASGGVKMLVESPVMFEAIRPFLDALKVEPETIPLSRYLVFRPPNFLRQCVIDPPEYARFPGFEFQLASLLPDDGRVDDLKLNVNNADSIEYARAVLRDQSRLDPSQVDAIIDALTRELSLIQGPPGTGKSYTGVELLRVLVKNKIKPILMIAFTNHALDHMLTSVLDAGITTDIVRLGSRSSDERISQYSIESREKVAGQSRLDRSVSQSHRDLKTIQEQIKGLMDKILKADLESHSSEVTQYIRLHYPEHHLFLCSPPQWIGTAKEFYDDDSDGSWQIQGRGGRAVNQDTSPYAYWRKAGDIQSLQLIGSSRQPAEGLSMAGPSKGNYFQALSSVDADASDSNGSGDISDHTDSDDDDGSSSTSSTTLDIEKCWMVVPDESENRDDVDDKDKDEVPKHEVQHLPPEVPHASPQSKPPLGTDIRDPLGYFSALGEEGIPCIPHSDRDLADLLVDGDVWGMSSAERERLHGFWIEEARAQRHQNQLGEFERLREMHVNKLREYNEAKDTVRRELLGNVDIIGCTTTGAAKLTALLKALSPRVLLVEEAGQVLEAHVLGSLVPSVKHLILIGDPLQLRPTLNNFSLSVDSRRGRELFKFDMSLMERLSTSGLSMSRLDVQRRMRPSISSLIRNTLYPGLQDHDLVLKYPDVRGVAKNLYFVTHNHRENGGGDDTASKYNVYEVDMIRDLVLYLLRQGCYSGEGDIVVLCAYLGQLARLRDALAGDVVTVIDERDQAELADREAEIDPNGEFSAIDHLKVTKRVRLRTVDNYQGEEGKIIILSLVRNSGSLEDENELGWNYTTRPNIGFLKSDNRTNVALSRAREGLYIFGNADNLSSQSEMWRSIVEELQANDSLGTALPVACFRHPTKLHHVSQPGQLPQIAPDGGCLEPCNTHLKCGHLCPFKCHPDDSNHMSVVCDRPCRRLCHRDHPCRKVCSAPCGDCNFPVPNVHLPCGHIKATVPCYQLDTLDRIYCDFVLEKRLPHCEHSVHMECSQNPEDYRCKARCGELMSCCGKMCNAPCYDCQRANDPHSEEALFIRRQNHHRHPCQKNLHCEHICQEACSNDHEHTRRCMEPCRQACTHAKCRLPCSEPCAPCKEQCTWTCPHRVCPVPCGSVCARLPCDLRCENFLACGHQCPSVCGEPCNVQICQICASEEKLAQVADLILQRPLSDIDPDMETLDELLITIPSCGHTFTVETLDGHCGMTEFYHQAHNEQWNGLEVPAGFTRPPTCPTCRSVIRTPRYSRVYKRADLDILERNVAAQMSRRLEQTQNLVDAYPLAEKKASLAKESLSFVLNAKDRSTNSKRLEAQKRARDAALKFSNNVPVAQTDINPANDKLHNITSDVLGIWRKGMHELLHAYKEAQDVAETRSAHAEAWEAAVSQLYQRELESIKGKTAISCSPDVLAMRLAKLQVGQPRPLADRRFHVEAFWMTIHIRLTMIDVVHVWLQETFKHKSSLAKKSQSRSWALYVQFLFDSCTRDTKIALNVAKDSGARRQVTRTTLHQMRIELEQFRFNLFMCKSTGRFQDSTFRKELAERARLHQARSEDEMWATLGGHRRKMSNPDEDDWLEKNFTSIMRDIVEEWRKIQTSICFDTFYQPVSLVERMEIIKAFSFAVAGHFYRCRNGHTFVIGECGGAVQTSLCPECGEAIGGNNHSLLQSNSRATEYEELLQREGAQPAYWQIP